MTQKRNVRLPPLPEHHGLRERAEEYDQLSPDEQQQLEQEVRERIAQLRPRAMKRAPGPPPVEIPAINHVHVPRSPWE